MLSRNVMNICAPWWLRPNLISSIGLRIKDFCEYQISNDSQNSNLGTTKRDPVENNERLGHKKIRDYRTYSHLVISYDLPLTDGNKAKNALPLSEHKLYNGIYEQR